MDNDDGIRCRSMQDYNEAAEGRQLGSSGEHTKKKTNNKFFTWILGIIVTTGLIALAPRHWQPPPVSYTKALNKALMFFNAQCSRRLPKSNEVAMEGGLCVKDGTSDSSSLFRDLAGGYYDTGDSIKFNFPQAFSTTMLSWNVIENRAKYEAAGELGHVKGVIKWGTDYFLKTFDNTADTMDRIVTQILQQTPPHSNAIVGAIHLCREEFLSVIYNGLENECVWTPNNISL